MNKPSRELAVIKPLRPPANLKALSSQLARAKTPEDVVDFERKVSAYEAYMRKAGFSQGDLHEINEHRMRARWRLGQMLRDAKKHQGGKRDRATSQAGKLFKELLSRLRLDKNRAQEAERIGWLPKIELERVFQRARKLGELVTIAWLVDEAEPYWYKERRKSRHRDIADKAKLAAMPDKLGPFPLIYADPPWTFETFTPKGHESHRMPEDHYPVMSDEEIEEFKIGDQSIEDIAAKDALLFLWCTSSNIFRAIDVMMAWGFLYKTQAVWDKGQIGTGLIFRNQHEVLLVGTRGNPPKPIKLFSSVFRYPRTKHSAKPPEIRQAIEQMYSLFDTPETKVELFSRGQTEGWTCVGFEASAGAGEDHHAARVDRKINGMGATVI